MEGIHKDLPKDNVSVTDITPLKDIKFMKKTNKFNNSFYIETTYIYAVLVCGGHTDIYAFCNILH